ncbi:MAG: Hsp20/alpha crystallin family protein [Rubrivivax sp.]|jgi:HSP20 family protein
MFIVPFARSTAPVSELVRYVDDILDRQAAGSAHAHARTALRVPKLDVAETDTAYTVTLDLPGVARDDVQVSVEGRRVTLKAEVRKADEGQAGERLVWRERSLAGFERAVVLPQEVDQASSSAKLDHGLLTLTLNKRQPATSTRLTIN